MAIFHIKANDGSSVDVSGANAFAAGGENTLIVDTNAYLISESGGDGALLGGSWTVTINGAVEAFAGSQGLYMNFGLNQSVTIGRTGGVFGSDTGVFLVGSTLSLPFTNGSHRLTNKGAISGGVVGVSLTSAAELTFRSRSTTRDRSTEETRDYNSLLARSRSRTVARSAVRFQSHKGQRCWVVSPYHQLRHALGRDCPRGIRRHYRIPVQFGVVDLGDGGDTFTDFQKVGKLIKNGTVFGSIDLGDGADHFNGGAHSEIVRDGGGADTYKLGGGNDFYFAVGGGATTGADFIDGGKGRDTYDATGASFNVLVNLDKVAHGLLLAQFAQGSDVGDPGNTDKVIGFENATGGSAGDLLLRIERCQCPQWRGRR